jgi:membrane protein DedA with SNARE-associated domain
VTPTHTILDLVFVFVVAIFVGAACGYMVGRRLG